MRKSLPVTGSAELLATLSEFVPDEFINALVPARRGSGRRRCFSAAQLWRAHLLALLTPAHTFNAIVQLLPEQRAWRRFAHLDPRLRTPDVRMFHEFRRRAGVWALRAIHMHLVRRLLPHIPPEGLSVGVIDATDLPACASDKKKRGHWSAQRASLGARTRRAGLSKFFVGYKKHTLRLWLRAHRETVLLVPLISWVAPAHLPEGYLLEASVRECQRRLAWRPDIIVGDLAYIRQEVKKAVRQKYGVAILTKMKPDMNLIDAFDTWNQMSCLQGQPLHWLGYDPSDQSHWFGPQANAALCLHCWEAHQCPREFAYRAALGFIAPEPPRRSTVTRAGALLD